MKFHFEELHRVGNLHSISASDSIGESTGTDLRHSLL